ncbi:MAG: hypothetical protein RLZZ488_2736 [Pseudomonadota bacterium]|jgi:5-(carboxyamino)imidazole ribonucleotide synthase
MTETPAQKTIGILGGGQLGLMLSQSLADLGAQVRILDPQPDCPAALRTAFSRTASFADDDALCEFFLACDRVTYEFEHIPIAALRRVLDKTDSHHKLWPSLSVLENSQNRVAEKIALAKADAPVAEWIEICSVEDLRQHKPQWLGRQRAGILKTARGGYDGKGQWRLSSEENWNSAIAELTSREELFPLVLEEKCQLLGELSVIVGRHPEHGVVTLPAVENIHVDGILDVTFYPPRLPAHICVEAKQIAEHVAQQWNVHGLLTVEFFVVENSAGTKLLANEVAPRPHNSGHVSRRSLSRSQFDLLAHILLDQPCQISETQTGVVWAMLNTLGDLWGKGSAFWPHQLTSHSAVCEAMLYGKPEVRRGRKMGHVILRGNTHSELNKHIQFLRSTFPDDKGV